MTPVHHWANIDDGIVVARTNIAGRTSTRPGRAFWRRASTPTSAPQQTAPDGSVHAGDDRHAQAASPVSEIPDLDAARTRLGFALKQYGRLLRDRIGRQADERATALVVHDFLTYGLGFRADEIARVPHSDGDNPVMTPVHEAAVDGTGVLLVEIVRCCARPSDRHARNLRPVAFARGLEWAVVTNGSLWQLHHVGGHDGVLAFEIDILGHGDGATATSETDAVAALALISRESCAQQTLQRYSSRLFA